MTVVEKIAAHNFEDSVIEYWSCEKEQFAELWIKGDFHQKETALTGKRYYQLNFSSFAEEKCANIREELENGTIKSLKVSKEEDLYHVELGIIGDREEIYTFSCKYIFCQTLSYKGLSYKNMYDTPEYKKQLETNAYVEAAEFFEEQENYELQDGYSMEVSKYIDMEKQGEYYSVKKALLYKCALKHNQERIFEYKATDFNEPPFQEFIIHSNGHRYLPFHVDLYGISYLDVDTLECYNYIPQGEDNDYGLACGESFIITDIHYDVNTNLIAYGGCYWASYYDVMVGDFSEPLNFNPKLISVNEMLFSKEEDYCYLDFVRWEGQKLVVQNDDNQEYAVSVEELREKLRQKEEENFV